MASPAGIRVIGARQHNLKNIDVEIPRGSLTVLTGLSGSGKSSLAFDTIYAEGQRRYVESLSAHARQFLEQMPRPDVDRIEGLSPTIAIQQRATVAGPRSTVATATEVYDYLRVLFARVGRPRCWECGRPIVKQSTAQVVDSVLAGPSGQRIMVLAPMVQQRRGQHRAVLERIVKEGFLRARIDGQITAIEGLQPLPPNRRHTIEVVVDRLTVKPQIGTRLADSVETAARVSGGRVIITAEVAPGQWSDEPYSASLACPEHVDVRIDDLSPQLFSFNSPHGACEECHGLGTSSEFDPDLVVPDQNRSLSEGAIAAWRHQGKGHSALYTRMLKEFCEQFSILDAVPFRNIPAPLRRILLAGTNDDEARQYGAAFEGVIPNLQRRWQTTDSEYRKQRLHTFMSDSACPRCSGSRLRKAALCVRIDERSIADITRMTVAEAASLFESLTFDGEAKPVAGPLCEAIRQRLRFMVDVGVEYLALDRAGSTLSGGEWQRIRLATQMGSQLSGVCYVLDEPTVGLHARDSRRLTEILTRMSQMGNTIIVVEHDEEVIAGATHLIDIGPGAGIRGGYLVAQGTPDQVLASDTSITAKYLTGKLSIPLPQQRRAIDRQRSVDLYGVTANNLKSINVRFPLGCLVCVTGVSGSGKSTLVTQVLARALRRRLDLGGPRPGAFARISGASLVDKVAEINQAPIGRTPRSNPATYVGAFAPIRQLYATTRESKIRGYGPSRFSFNVKGGRCEHCEGQGLKRIAMHFLPDVFVTCDHCGGKRYNRETLEVRYRGKTIANVLDLSVEEAVAFFENFPNIHRRLQVLKDVGLGYVTLGQSSNTLSGGEAQRVKLASELHQVPPRLPLAKGGVGGSTVYILDEPTTGLHFADVRNLLTVLNRLVDGGQTVIVVEHNLDMIKVADWIIDLGPEGGEAGGSIVVEGTPEQVAAHPASHTGRFLKDRLAGRLRLATGRSN